MTNSAKKPIIDLASLLPSQDAELELRHPVTKDPLGVFIRVASADSAQFAAAQRARTNGRIAKAKQTGDASIPAEEQEEENLKLLINSTLGWRNMLVDGKELEFTPENVRMVYTNYVWIREYVDREIANRGNFLRS